MMLKDKRVHFISIGGAIMHQLAIQLHKKGNKVSGSDDVITDPAKSNLQKFGLLPEAIGWFPEKINTQTDLIILGMHAKNENPELIKAKQLNIEIYSFPKLIYELSKNKMRVVVAGSHGKTTTTAMIMTILKENNKKIDYLVGGSVAGFTKSVKITEDSETMVIEGDEYPASVIDDSPKIFYYQPHISVLTGIAWDHMNVYPNFERYKDQFKEYIKNLSANSILYYNSDDDVVNELVTGHGKHLITHPFTLVKYKVQHNKFFIELSEGNYHPLRVFGKHNISNLSGAIMPCVALGLDRFSCLTSMLNYNGVKNRQEILINDGNLLVIRDFAHAPSKVLATVQAVKDTFRDYKLIACYELHTFSSVNQNFLPQYRGTLNASDKAILFIDDKVVQRKSSNFFDIRVAAACFDYPNEIDVCQSVEALISTLRKIFQIYSVSKCPLCLLLMSSGSFMDFSIDLLPTYDVN